MKCKVLPPRQLYHPVLPYREHDKLTFPLCALCPELEIGKPMLSRTCVCPHTDDARALVGTWCTPELEKAVELGMTSCIFMKSGISRNNKKVSSRTRSTNG